MFGDKRVHPLGDDVSVNLKECRRMVDKVILRIGTVAFAFKFFE
jgi:hypothetical protein